MSCAPGNFVCIVNNCSGNIGSGTKLFDYWLVNNCPAAYSQLINTSATGTLQYNPVNQLVAQNKVVQLFNTYLQTNSLTDDVTSSSFNIFQNTLLELCINPTLPGVCAKWLESYCDGDISGNTGCAINGVGCTGYSREQVNNSPTLINFCGCYTPPDPVYLQYTLGSPGCQIGTGCTAGCTAGNTGCTGQPACDPLCHRALTSQKAFQPTGTIITCPQEICAIDNATINVTKSSVAGGINFNSICSGCGGASGGDGCLCIVTGVNISATFSSLGVGSNVNQFCSGSSVCIVEDSAGNIISQGGCTGINPANGGIPSSSFLPNLGILFIMILLVLLILFISIAARVSVPVIPGT